MHYLLKLSFIFLDGFFPPLPYFMNKVPKRYRFLASIIVFSLYTAIFISSIIQVIEDFNIYFHGWIPEHFLLLSYVVLWLFATYTAIVATRALYATGSEISKLSVLLYVLLSVVTCVFGFALAYLDISQSDPTNAFNIKQPLTGASAFYFSIVTFATVGYGDISPARDSTRLLVSMEIIISMMYTILVFSVVAGFIQKETSE
jgi:hypothetical protein